ncbi:TIGR04283 family arsenosugar biosynthesis glycosyltransferase [Methylotuvimicrobium buryatense]|uniref:Glycosyltransferase n=1 Tax=Methylotuvimicrobium buryatense TaxID=95641 RepID=A0A4P9USF3_METBY|nr:TIGR04283 family arsenosugar biosynthesis glycosyltransferase [Methylotuvimicrobium buryatense]QCW84367.1 glycosyltransferase [Methylotuvimicrobium buryatense]
MHFSIIIPTLNEQTSIVECLGKLQHLREHAEIIVSDGGSSDRTVALAEDLADLVLTGSVGRAKQMNRGAKHAHGEVLIFLHADTVLPEQALNSISQALNEGACWGRFDIRLCGSHVMLKVIAALMNLRSRWTGIATGDQAIFVHRKAFDSVGGFPDIALMEDIALSKSLKNWSKPACLSARVVSSGRRWESYGIYRTILLMWSLRLRYFLGSHPETLAYLYRTGKLWKP